MYAFCVEANVVYVGLASRSLRQRLYGYERPAPSQRTNVRVQRLIQNEIEAGMTVEVLTVCLRRSLITLSISSENLLKELHPIQIDSTHFCFKPRRNPGFRSRKRSANRTAVWSLSTKLGMMCVMALHDVRDGPRARARGLLRQTIRTAGPSGTEMSAVRALSPLDGTLCGVPV